MNRINGTRFLTQDELAKTLTEINIHETTYPVGGIPMLVKGDKLYIDAEDTHTMIFGATGSKKTRMFAMPAIGIFARAGESFVVTDPKGELYGRTIGDVVSYGYESNCINLRDFKAGVTWNPLALPYRYYHNGKKAKAIEYAVEMSKMIIGENATDEAFWINTAVDVFSGFILLLFELSSEEECHFRSLYELWRSYIADRKKAIGKIKELFGEGLIYQRISSLDNPSEKTVGSIEAFISMGLNKLGINEEFIEFLSQKGLDLQELAGKKNAIYLVIPDENTSYHFVASLFLEQLYEVLIEKAQNEASHMLPIRMNFLIDEFANIPKIQNMDAMITASRSRNIRFHLIVQGMKQLEQKYEKSAETIMGNCNNWVYLYSKEYNLLEEISRLCGEVIYDNNVRMPLFSEFDLQHLSKEKGEALVLSGRNLPCLTNLADIDEYPYPILSAKETESLKPWQTVMPFHWRDGKTPPYFCEIDRFDDPYKRKKLTTRKFKENRRWLVAVGPENMILAEGEFDKDLIDSKAAMGMLTNSVLDEMELESEYIEWYSALPTIKEIYQGLKKEHPENVYVTLEELGEENFTKEMERRNTYGHMEKVRKSEISLFFTTNPSEPGDNRIDLGSVDVYARNVGTRYLLNHAFRRANQELKESTYAEVNWHYKGRKFTYDGVSVYRFAKKNVKGEFAVLQVTDCRESLNGM